MLIWIILFFIIIILSFVLALKSMNDYQGQPLALKLQYSLFLVKNPTEFTLEILQDIHEETSKNNTIISLEKLFKGEKTALVIFAPKELLNKFSNVLNLLELEDYSLKEINNVKVWEIGSNNLSPKLLERDFTIKLPNLKEDEQLWWQIILKPKSSNYQCREKNVYFQSLIRAVLLTADKSREQEVSEILFTRGKELGLNVLPQSHSGNELLKFYQQRILPLNYHKDLGEEILPLLTNEQVIALLA